MILIMTVTTNVNNEKYTEGFENVQLLKTKSIINRGFSMVNSYGRVEKGQKIPIVSDVMFKCMLGNENRKVYLLTLLNAIFKYFDIGKINDLDYIKNNVDQNNFYDKGRVVDLLAKSTLGVLNVEVNNNSSSVDKYMLRRNVGYGFAISNSMIKKGNKKIKFIPFIQININNFSVKGENRSAVLYYLSDNRGTPLTDDFLIIEIYLPNIRKKWYNKKEIGKYDELEELEKILLIYNEDIKELNSHLYKGDECMEKYLKDAFETSQDNEVIGLYDLEELRKEQMIVAEQSGYDKGIKEGVKEGVKQGIEQGIEQERLAIAESLLKRNISIDEIIEITNLSKEQIESLK